MKRRTRRFGVALVLAGGLTAGGAFVDEMAGAAITDPVDYTVGAAADGSGGVRVFFQDSRNSSCSVSRVVLNNEDSPRRVIMWVTWDGQLEPVLPQPGTSAMDGDDVLAAGEQSTVVFTNDGHISPTATGMRLHTLVLIPDGVAQIGAQVSEDIEPCRADTSPPTVPTVPAVPESTVPVTDPPPVTVPGPGTTTPPPLVVPDPAPSTTADVEVETSSIQRQQLPNTGRDSWRLVFLGAGLLVTGWSVLRGRDRLTQEDV